MATPMEGNYSRENGPAAATLASSSASKKVDGDDVPDYNEAFPQLRSAGPADGNRSNTFFSSTFPSNGSNSNNAMASTTSSMYSAAKNDEDRRRKMALHASSVTTKIVSAHHVLVD